jgi:hypothetical protein
MSIQETLNKKFSAEIERAIEIGNKYNPNVYGQFPWDAGEYPRDGRPHRSLNLSKASLGTFFEAALRHRMGISRVYAFDARYKQCAVLVRCHATLEQRDNFMEETGFWLAPPPMAHVN